MTLTTTQKTETNPNTLTDVDLVSQWLAAKDTDADRASILLAESQKRGAKRMGKAFAALAKK